MKKYLILLIIFLTTSISVRSQEIIDLDKAISTALKNNATVNNLQRNLQIQQLNIGTAKGNLYPNLDFNATWNRNNTYSDGTVRFQNGVPIIIPKQNTWINNFNVGLTSDVVLFNGFANYQQVDYENQSERLARTKLDKEKYDIVYKVNAAFFDVLKKDKIVEVNESNLEDSRRQLESIKEFMNVGKKTIADVYRQDVQVAQDELDVERSKNELNKSKVDLLFAMNTNLNQSYEISETSIDPNLTDADLKEILYRNSNTEQLYNRAINKRFDYKSYVQDIKLNETQLSIDNKSLYYPTISAFGNYNLNASRISDIENSRSFSFGLQITYPIFQGNRLSNKSQITEVTIKQREEDLRQLEQQIRSDIKKATIDLETQYKQIDILNRSIVSSEQDKLLSEENYRVGLGTLLDVQTATTKLNELRVNLINAYYDFLLAERTVRYYSGDLNY